MQVVITAAGGSAWSYAASILTFVVPMLLFILVAGSLWVTYTRPRLDPARPRDGEQPSVITSPRIKGAVPAEPPVQAGSQAQATDTGGPADVGGPPAPAGE